MRTICQSKDKQHGLESLERTARVATMSLNYFHTESGSIRATVYSYARTNPVEVSSSRQSKCGESSRVVSPFNLGRRCLTRATSIGVFAVQRHPRLELRTVAPPLTAAGPCFLLIFLPSIGSLPAPLLSQVCSFHISDWRAQGVRRTFLSLCLRLPSIL